MVFIRLQQYESCGQNAFLHIPLPQNANNRNGILGIFPADSFWGLETREENSNLARISKGWFSHPLIIAITAIFLLQRQVLHGETFQPQEQQSPNYWCDRVKGYINSYQ